MEHDKPGRVIGIIHGGSLAPPGGRTRPPPRPRSLRLVARPDANTAGVIDKALQLFYTRGHLAAIDYLVNAKVPLRTISRVLWKPQLRRGG